MYIRHVINIYLYPKQQNEDADDAVARDPRSPSDQPQQQQQQQQSTEQCDDNSDALSATDEVKHFLEGGESGKTFPSLTTQIISRMRQELTRLRKLQ